MHYFLLVINDNVHEINHTDAQEVCSERSGYTHHASVFIPETFIVDEIHPNHHKPCPCAQTLLLPLHLIPSFNIRHGGHKVGCRFRVGNLVWN